MKISLISLGCPKNLVDSEIILGILVKSKFVLTNDWKNSDVIIINTCAFLQTAVSEAEDWIRKALRCKKTGSVKKVIVAGCLPQRYKSAILDKFPEIDDIIGIDHLNNIPKLLLGKTNHVKVIKMPQHLYNCKVPRILSTTHYAYLKIADGCDNFCSYCLIPSIRGRFRSRNIDDVVMESKQLAECGVKELILIAQDTTLYGKDIYNRLSLARLLKHLVKIKGIEWIRLLYTHPVHWTDELIEVYKENHKICRYVDLPLQHISDNILKMMNRPYDRKTVEKLLVKLRKISNLVIRTSFIVGFPGETDKDFNELLGFVKEQKFAHLGCFKYSREQGTVAYNLPNQVPEKIKREHYNKIMATQQKISLKRMQGFIGKKVKVIIDGKSKDRRYKYIGRSQYDAPEIDGVVYISSPATLSQKPKDLNQGDFAEVKITNAQPYTLIAIP